MFCPNCGNSQPEDAALCSNCGTPFNTVAASVPATPTIRMKKGQYLKSALASSKAKALSKAVLIIFAVCTLIVVLSISNLLNGAVHKLPVMTLAFDEGEAENLEKELEDLDKAVEDARDLFEKNEDKFSKESAKAVEKALDKSEKFAKNPSLTNVQGIITSLGALEEKYADEIKEAGLSERLDVEGFSEEIEEITDVLDILKTVFILLGAIIILFALFTALFKKIGFAIMGLILALPVCAFCGGTLYTVLAAVTFIVFIVMVIMINAEYKKYKKSLK